MVKRTEELCVPAEGQKVKVCARCQARKLKCLWKPEAPSKTWVLMSETGSEKVKEPEKVKELEKGKGKARVELKEQEEKGGKGAVESEKMDTESNLSGPA